MRNPLMPIDRRGFCKMTSLSAIGWLATRALAIADAQPEKPTTRPKALIVLWLDGGPSQLETFDPHPGTAIGGPTGDIATSASGVRIASGLPQIAEQMHAVSLIRSVVTKDAEHERARYYMKTGYRPSAQVTHPSLGAICAANLPVAGIEIPRYISILSNDRQARGGYLGEAYDPFKISDPANPPPDVMPRVDRDRLDSRIAGLDVIEKVAGARNPGLADRTAHRQKIDRALAMVDSQQLDAFDLSEESAATKSAYGDSPFGRGCLTARRLVEVGVRAVEVQLGGWDTHRDNFSQHDELKKSLDPAFAALLRDLAERDLLASTVVLCCGEFGRTPKINPLDGRDHWAKGFSIVLAGGLIRPNVVLGETDPSGEKAPTDPVSVPDVYATILHSLGVDPAREYMTPQRRPIKLCEGTPIRALLSEAVG